MRRRSALGSDTCFGSSSPSLKVCTTSFARSAITKERVGPPVSTVGDGVAVPDARVVGDVVLLADGCPFDPLLPERLPPHADNPSATAVAAMTRRTAHSLRGFGRSPRGPRGPVKILSHNAWQRPGADEWTAASAPDAGPPPLAHRAPGQCLAHRRLRRSAVALDADDLYRIGGALEPDAR